MEKCFNKKFYEIYLKEDKDIVLRSLKKAYENIDTNFKSIIKSGTDRESIYFETHLTLIEYGTEKIIQAICRDITQIIRVENEIMNKMLKYNVDKGLVYLIEEPVLDKSLDVFNNLLECGFNGYIFSGNLPLLKKVGLKSHKRTIFYTSKIEARLVEYQMYEGTKKIKYEK